MKFHKASKTYGDCDSCQERIRKGQSYARTLRYPLPEEERSSVPKVSPPPSVSAPGQRVAVKIHEECEPKWKEFIAARRTAQNEARRRARALRKAESPPSTKPPAEQKDFRI